MKEGFISTLKYHTDLRNKRLLGRTGLSGALYITCPGPATPLPFPYRSEFVLSRPSRFVFRPFHDIYAINDLSFSGRKGSLPDCEQNARTRVSFIQSKCAFHLIFRNRRVSQCFDLPDMMI